MRGQLASRPSDVAVQAGGSNPKDLEREAFNAELDRIAAAREEVPLLFMCPTNKLRF